MDDAKQPKAKNTVTLNRTKPQEYTIYPARVVFCNESFMLDRIPETQGFYLSHERWSISGSGMTLAEAELSLLSEAKYLINYYTREGARLTQDAVEFKLFLERLILR
jgi:hypothetical protein